MEPSLAIDAAVVVSNMLLVAVTVVAVIATAREGHRHEEQVLTDTEKAADAENKRLSDIVHEVLRQEREDPTSPTEGA